MGPQPSPGKRTSFTLRNRAKHAVLVTNSRHFSVGFKIFVPSLGCLGYLSSASSPPNKVGTPPTLGNDCYLQLSSHDRGQRPFFSIAKVCSSRPRGINADHYSLMNVTELFLCLIPFNYRCLETVWGTTTKHSKSIVIIPWNSKA